MNKPGIHRVTATSRKGRSMISPGVESAPWRIDKEIRDWNEAVDQKKALKNAKKNWLKTALGV